MPSINWTPKALFAMGQEIWKASAIGAAIKLSLFPAIAELAPNSTATALADKIGADPRGLGMLLTALTALDLLHKDRDSYRLTEFASQCLLEKSPDYYGDILVHFSYLIPAWSQLEKSIQTGQKYQPSQQKPAQPERNIRAFLMGMHNVARLQAETVAKALDLSQAKTLLDLGGGPGTYAATFCRQYPQLSAVVFDRPTSEPIFQEVVHHYGMERRVSFQSGDFLTSPLPSGFDAVWLSQVLHGESFEKATELVQRAAATLNPRGILAIQEFVLNDERDGPLGPALFSLNMLLQTEGGSSYTVSEISQMMEKAGVLGISEVLAPLPPGNRIFWGTLSR
ncbi:MAG: methyltransferase domain-containing protein [Deltaproteobacteria bacterium]|jgi:hypothetical protein|nr:methyltransferase domain-containing protein [Deltaproteobacteria bacterium]